MRLLNPNTTFSLVTLTDEFKSNSACYLVYGDCKFFHFCLIQNLFVAATNIEEEVLSKGLSMDQFDNVWIVIDFLLVIIVVSVAHERESGFWQDLDQRSSPGQHYSLHSL